MNFVKRWSKRKNTCTKCLAGGAVTWVKVLSSKNKQDRAVQTPGRDIQSYTEEKIRLRDEDCAEVKGRQKGHTAPGCSRRSNFRGLLSILQRRWKLSMDIERLSFQPHLWAEAAGCLPPPPQLYPWTFCGNIQGSPLNSHFVLRRGSTYQEERRLSKT